MGSKFGKILKAIPATAMGAAKGYAKGGWPGLALGATGGALSELTKKKGRQLSAYSGPQQAMMNKLMQTGFANMGPEAVEGLATKRFHEQIVPGLAERFTSMGGGAQRSSAFQSAVGRAGSDLSYRLAALRSQMGMQQMKMGLNQQFKPDYLKSQPGIGQDYLQQLMSGESGGKKGLLSKIGKLFKGRGGGGTADAIDEVMNSGGNDAVNQLGQPMGQQASALGYGQNVNPQNFGQQQQGAWQFGAQPNRELYGQSMSNQPTADLMNLLGPATPGTMQRGGQSQFDFGGGSKPYLPGQPRGL